MNTPTASQVLDMMEAGMTLYMEYAPKKRAYLISPLTVVSMPVFNQLLDSRKIKEGPAVYKGNRYVLSNHTR